MPYKPASPCLTPGCPGRAQHNGYCPAHYKQYRKSIDPTGQRYDRNWSKVRLSHLNEHPLCIMCEQARRTEAAIVVDHVIPHRGDRDKFWDADNLQSLCIHHHAVKTHAETLNGQSNQ